MYILLKEYEAGYGGISMQELERIALEQYCMTVINARKIRGAVLCNTDQGIYLLKETNVPKQRLKVLAALYEYLKEQSWCTVDEMVKNKEGEYITEAEGKASYIVKKWYTGKECDLRKPAEILEATGILAKLHLFMRREIEGMKTNLEDMPIKLYERHNKELKKVRKFVRKMSPKGEFEYTFLQNFENMYCWAEAAEELLNGFDYDTYYQEAVNRKSLVHGEYNYHNILMRDVGNSDESIAITNFDKAGYGIQIEDLYYFMRKTMEKHGWKDRIGDSMLNAYSAVNPLSRKDLEYLKIRFVYPEKFWKTANAYYYSNKAWVSVKNMEKLEMAICQIKEKERFLYNIYQYKIE